MPRPSHYSWFYHPTILGEEYRLFSSSLCNFLHSPITSSLLGPNILLNTLFSNTLSLRSSLNVSDRVSHPYKTTGKIIVLYINIVFPLLNLCMHNVCDLTEIQYGFPVSSQILQNAVNFRRRNWICLSDTHPRYKALKLWLPHILVPGVLLYFPSYEVCIFSLFQVTISIPYFCVIFLFLLNPVSFFSSLKIHPLGIVEILTAKLTVIAILRFPLQSKRLFVGYIRHSA